MIHKIFRVITGPLVSIFDMFNIEGVFLKGGIVMKKCLLLFIIVILLGCQNTNSPVEGMLGEEIEIDIGDQVTFPDEAISVTFIDLLEDSRCPKGVTCVWAGNAKIAIQFNDEEINLNTYLDPKKAGISEYNVALVSVDPYPVHQKEIQKEDYVATLIITKN